MAGPEFPRPRGTFGRGARRAAVLAWVACAAVVWNVAFDGVVTEAVRDYLARQARHQEGGGPEVSLRAVMDPAVARAARTANASGAGVIGAGGLAILLAGLARPRRSAGRAR